MRLLLSADGYFAAITLLYAEIIQIAQACTPEAIDFPFECCCPGSNSCPIRFDLTVAGSWLRYIQFVHAKNPSTTLSHSVPFKKVLLIVLFTEIKSLMDHLTCFSVRVLSRRVIFDAYFCIVCTNSFASHMLLAKKVITKKTEICCFEIIYRSACTISDEVQSHRSFVIKHDLQNWVVL